MNNLNLTRVLDCIKFQIVEAFNEAADIAGRELTDGEAIRMIELLGRLSNAQECLKMNLTSDKIFVELGQLEAWDKVFENRGADVADAMFGPRAIPLEA